MKEPNESNVSLSKVYMASEQWIVIIYDAWVDVMEWGVTVIYNTGNSENEAIRQMKLKERSW